MACHIANAFDTEDVRQTLHEVENVSEIFIQFG